VFLSLNFSHRIDRGAYACARSKVQNNAVEDFLKPAATTPQLGSSSVALRPGAQDALANRHVSISFDLFTNYFKLLMTVKYSENEWRKS